jgi:peptidoglycan/xylan/chitin deacetylase (PgdA/CDA1 family)
MAMNNILSFDVEEWFQVELYSKLISRDDWASYPLRVPESMAWILGALARNRVQATFFVLGWIAERLPALVRQIADEGRAASHGWSHAPVWRLSPAGSPMRSGPGSAAPSHSRSSDTALRPSRSPGTRGLCPAGGSRLPVRRSIFPSTTTVTASPTRPATSTGARRTFGRFTFRVAGKLRVPVAGGAISVSSRRDKRAIRD